MAKMGWGKWAGLVSISVLLRLLAVIAQPGFLSIDCGGKTNHTDENNITWISDANYIDVGNIAEIRNASKQTDGSYLHTLRFFPKPLNKSCYQLPVIPNVRYLLRLTFAVGNYSEFPNLSILNFAFSIETLGMMAVRNIHATTNIPPFREYVLVSSGTTLYICFIRTFDTNDPFISTIELRTLQDGMYQQAKPGTMLSLERRSNLGGLLVRYPQDEFDRLWLAAVETQGDAQDVSSEDSISTNHTQDLPPPVVMQTAWVGSSYHAIGITEQAREGNTSLLLLYFAEIQSLSMNETRSFNVFIDGRQLPQPISMMKNYSALELLFPLKVNQFDLVLMKASDYTYDPIINAYEYYSMIDTERATYLEDIEALNVIKRSLDIKSWIADPCYVIYWDGISCDNNSSIKRISEINLSRMNLTGTLPKNIGQLTALVSLSLDNNHLTGPLPNLSNLTMLQRLHLQNNNFTGSVPEWLTGLKKLKELFIENNAFSGAIPAQLLSNSSLEFRYTGNRYLHVLSKSKKDRLSLISGISITGSIVIILFFTVGIVVHRKKSRRKEGSRVEKESKDTVDEDNSMTIQPNTTMSRAFTLEEITLATQNFSQKIGQGGFGSVFFGKLQQGKDIAVKVLSLFSKQGIQEFINEVDLLSRVHHRNLVSLLGYCNESKELMLVYEHMSGGSLRDHLYGPTAEPSQLNWNTRLKIASDAAQGLEYLHVGCSPKIIHRDIKTANILLDRNFNGKLADFGLSRMTIDGEDSHVTTTVKGTLGYLDPEYFSTNMLTEKSDVYSFGVVLLEIICGRQPIDKNLCEEQLNLTRWVTPYVEMDASPGKLAEIIDKRLSRYYDIKSITDVAKLAIRCVRDEPSSRPHVSEVVAELNEAIKLEEHRAYKKIDLEYRDSDARSVCLSIDSSEPKEMMSTESSSSKLPTVPQE